MMPLGDISTRFNLPQRSEDFRRSLRNSVWSVLDYLVLPMLFLVVTPFVALRLGIEQFGLWMLVNALTGSMGIFNLGLGEATIKYVSAHRTRNDVEAVARVVRSTTTVYGLLGLGTAGIVASAAPFLVARVFKVGPADQNLAILAFEIGGFVLAARFLESVFSSTLRGYERYDLAARVTIIVKGLTIAAIVALVSLGHGIVAILWATLALTAASALAQAVLTKKLIPGVAFWPLLDRAALCEVFGFGFYSWLQGMAGMVFAQVDRLLIGAMLGTTPLTYYSICQKLAMQIHAALGAAVSFLFPLSSAATERGDRSRLRSIYFCSLTTVTVLATAIGIPMFLFAHSILRLWMGAEFADQSATILRALVFPYTLMATSIVPYYFLNGTGRVRLNTLLGGVSGIVVGVATALLIPSLGVGGAAWAKLCNAPVWLASRAYIHWKILSDRRPLGSVWHFSPLVLPFAGGALVLWASGEPHLVSAPILLVALAGCGLGAVTLAVAIAYGFHLHRPTTDPI